MALHCKETHFGGERTGTCRQLAACDRGSPFDYKDAMSVDPAGRGSVICKVLRCHRPVRRAGTRRPGRCCALPRTRCAPAPFAQITTEAAVPGAPSRDEGATARLAESLDLTPVVTGAGRGLGRHLADVLLDRALRGCMRSRVTPRPSFGNRASSPRDSTCSSRRASPARHSKATTRRF